MTGREFFLTVSAVLILLMHVIINFSVEAFHARDLFIGMVPFSLLFVLGMETWWEKLKSGRIWSHKLITLLIGSWFYILTLFHFQQQALVSVIKSAVEGRQILLEPVLSIVALTVIFALGWRFFIAVSRSFASFVFGGVAQDDGDRLAWRLTAGLFTANLIILFRLVIPRLYQF